MTWRNSIVRLGRGETAMAKKISFLFLALFFVFLFSSVSHAAKTKLFMTHEKILEKMDGEFETIGEVTLKPGEEKSFQAYSFKPVTIDFKTSLSMQKARKVKNEGIGIKKLSSLKYYLKDPLGASMDVLPDDGVVKVSVKNFEKFPITVKLYKVHKS